MNDDGSLWQEGQFTNGYTTGDWTEHYEDGSYGIGQF